MASESEVSSLKMWEIFRVNKSRLGCIYDLGNLCNILIVRFAFSQWTDVYFYTVTSFPEKFGFDGIETSRTMESQTLEDCPTHDIHAL